MDAPTRYEIRIEGHLGSSWASWFEGLTLSQEENGETAMTGTLADQAALHGVLMRIRDLGLPLVAVRKLGRVTGPETRDRVEEEQAS